MESIPEDEVRTSVSTATEKALRGPTPEQRTALYESAVWRGHDHGGHRVRSLSSKRFSPYQYRTRGRPPRSNIGRAVRFRADLLERWLAARTQRSRRQIGDHSGGSRETGSSTAT